MKRARGQIGRLAVAAGSAILRKGRLTMRQGAVLIALVALALFAALVMVPDKAIAATVSYGAVEGTGQNLGGFTITWTTCTSVNATPPNATTPLYGVMSVGTPACTFRITAFDTTSPAPQMMLISDTQYGVATTVTGIDFTGNLRDYQEATNPGTTIGMRYQLGYVTGGTFYPFPGEATEARDYSTQANWTTSLASLTGTAPAGSYLAFRVTKDNGAFSYRIYSSTTANILNVDEVAACSDPDPTTSFTINPPTSGSTFGGSTYTVQATVAGEGTPGSGSATITIAGTTGGTCDVTGAAMTWNAGNSKWEYSWNIAACGNPVDGGITIDAAYTDPDCSDVTNATQITNITIDNTCVDSSPSTITVLTGQTLNGDPYNATSVFSTTGNVGSFQYFVVNATSSAGPSVDEQEYFDNDESTCDFVNWTAATGTGTLCTDPMGNGQFGTHNSAVADNGDGTHSPSAGTGPTSLHSGTHGTNGGFAYIEASGTGPYTATLTRNAQFNADETELHVSFAYSAYGANGIELKLEANDGTGWVTEWSVIGDDGNAGAWTVVDLNLYSGAGASAKAYTSGMVDLRFSWNMNSFAGDWAIDTIRVYGPGRVVASETTCTNWTSAGNALPATTGNGSLCGDFANGGSTHKIDIKGIDPDCGGYEVISPGSQNFTWNACTDPDPTTGFTINPPTTGSTISGDYLIQATVAGEGSPGSGSANITVAGSSSCDVTGAAMSWNGTSSKWEYTWNTSSCGDPIESGITIDANYIDPDCSSSFPATQVTSITLDNTDPYSIMGCNGCHLSPPAENALRNGADGAIVGSHDAHSNGLSMACTECHIDNGSTLPHRTGIINMTSLINSAANSSYSKGTSFAQTATPALGYCSNTYCHSNGTNLTSPWVSSSPTWGTTATCTTCHTKPPAYASGSPKANSHVKHPSDCSYCHDATTSDGGNSITTPANHGNKAYNVIANSAVSFSYTYNVAGGTCATISCHGGGTAQWGTTLGCTDCHGGSVSSPVAASLDATVTTRRGISGEFGMTWSHKRTAGGTVTSNDCGVCHMEGTASTGASNPTYHANGYVELRDPDTGLTIKDAYFNGGTPGAYLSNTTDARFVRFSRDLASSTLEPAVMAIQVNHCLKCHDAGGAASSAAWVPSGTAGKPFNTTIAHTTGGNVLNVDAHFNTTNSSYHPVKGKQNNSYADVDLMLAPWNQTSKTAGTTTQWGDLISCWDCHARPTDSGTLTNTVTAHGATDTLRGASTVSGTPSVSNAATLCLLCHDMTTYNQATPGHGPNSAASNLNRTQKVPFLQYGCNVCHSSGYNTAATRPARSEDVHGTNTLPATGQTLSGRWSTAGTPIAFIRNRSYLGNHEPLKVGATTYSPQCNMVGTDGNGACTNQGAKTYTVGGTY